jgi:hypothetical protein
MNLKFNDYHALIMFLLIIVLLNGCRHFPVFCMATVDLTELDLVYNNHLGDNWIHSAIVNGKKNDIKFPIIGPIRLYQAKLESLAGEIALSITVTVVEEEESPDIGTKSETISLVCLKSGELKESRILEVIVKEDKGRYAGEEAKWAFKFLITLVSNH